MSAWNPTIALVYPGLPQVAWRTSSGAAGPETPQVRMDEIQPTPESQAADSTAVLVARARAGDARAHELLYGRYAARLRRWAAGRMPAGVRDGMETIDLVQDAFVNVFKNLDHIEPRFSGALFAYMRRAVLNRIRDQIRRAGARDRALVEAGPMLAGEPSPLAHTIGREALARYEAALERLSDNDREAVVARLEMDCSYEELADVLGKPSADAARMTVKRALSKLAREMEEVPYAGA